MHDVVRLAHRRGAISRRKVLDLAQELKVPRKEIEQAIDEKGAEPELVDAVVPE